MLTRLAVVLLSGAVTGCDGADDGEDLDFRCFESGHGAGLIGLAPAIVACDDGGAHSAAPVVNP